MNYYLDESGNWENIEQEKNRLVIGGLLIKSKDIVADIERDFKLFKIRENLEIIHANELSNRQKEELYYLIEKYLSKDEVKSFFYIINPEIFYSQTQRYADEIYVDTASKLIVDMSFGDRDIDIEYDMKFHYAYLPNILEHINKNKDYDDFSQMSSNFVLNKSKIQNNQNRIIKQLNRYKNSIQDYENTLQKIKSDEKFLSKYLWEEFRLKIEKAYSVREIFKDKVASFTKQRCHELFLEEYDFNIDIKYKNKFKQSSGVQIADILCNLVWKHGKNTPKTYKDIYNKLNIKEINNG